MAYALAAAVSETFQSGRLTLVRARILVLFSITVSSNYGYLTPRPLYISLTVTVSYIFPSYGYLGLSYRIFPHTFESAYVAARIGGSLSQHIYLRPQSISALLYQVLVNVLLDH